jgi:Fe-S-cluster containining protein
MRRLLFTSLQILDKWFSNSEMVQLKREFVLKKYKELSIEVESLLQAVELESKVFFEKNNISCAPGCGKCCSNPEIEATALEMLPLAMHFLKSNRAEEMLDLLNNSERDYCLFYNHQQDNKAIGACTAYEHRPSLCRLFGAFKMGDRYSVCGVIKESHAPEVKKMLEDKPPATSINLWAMKLFNLDPELGRVALPINLALKNILEKLVSVYHFEKK